MTKAELARRIVEAIHADLYGRSGFDSWWDGIDEETAEEIMRTLTRVVVMELSEAQG